jgi:hypothetical protein
MMMTPAGTIAPARFHHRRGRGGPAGHRHRPRLGAVVEAFDTRPVVEEQVKSLGAKLRQGRPRRDRPDQGRLCQGAHRGAARQTARGDGQSHCAGADIVITTAQVFGRPAPRILTARHDRGMKPGSIVVDMRSRPAATSKARVLDAGSGRQRRPHHRPRQPARPRAGARQPDVSSNLVNFVEHFWNKTNRPVRPADATTKSSAGSLVTHGGDIVHPVIKPLKEEWKTVLMLTAVRLCARDLPRRRAHRQGPLAVAHPADVRLQRHPASRSSRPFWRRALDDGLADHRPGHARRGPATMNVVGGYLVTNRMLGMFRKKDGGAK